MGKPFCPLEQKTTKVRHDIALYAFHYDIRVDCSMERPVPGPSVSDSTVSHWRMERLKRRTSYRLANWKSGKNVWQIDVTEVLAKSKTSTSGSISILPKSFELEFEIINDKDYSALLDWLNCLPSEELAWTQRITDELYRCMDLCCM